MFRYVSIYITCDISVIGVAEHIIKNLKKESCLHQHRFDKSPAQSHVWISQVHAYEWVMAHMWMSEVAHAWLSRVTQMIESCHSNDWVMSHKWLSHVTQMIESCHTSDWVMSRKWLSHVTQMIESCRTYWVMLHTFESCHTHVSHVTHTCESCHTRVSHVAHMWVMSHTLGHVTRVNK